MYVSLLITNVFTNKTAGGDGLISLKYNREHFTSTFDTFGTFTDNTGVFSQNAVSTFI